MMHILKKCNLIVFLSSLSIYLWTYVSRLCGPLQLGAQLTYPLEYLVTLYLLINGWLYTYSSVCLLWSLSMLCFYLTKEVEEELKKQKVKLIAPKNNKDTDSVITAEKFMALFQVWLHDEENVETEWEPLEEKICRLQSAQKQMKRAEVVMATLRAQSFYHSHCSAPRGQRMFQLLDQYDYTTAYVELRLQMLRLVQQQFCVFLERGKELKICLSEALEFQESLHQIPCDSRLIHRQQLSLTQVIQKQYEMMKGMLEAYESSAKKVTATLQEMSELSGSFRGALGKNPIQPAGKSWSHTLTATVMEEVTQVTQRFSTLLKLNECYQTHLRGLQRLLR